MSERPRQSIFEPISSPDRLDQRLNLVRPKDWLVMCTMATLMILVVLWSIVGRLPVTVAGQGVLIRPRRIIDIQAPSSGRLAQLTIQVGDRIQEGEVIGRIEQAGIRQRLEEERRKLQQLLAQDQAKSTLQTQQIALRGQQNALAQRTIQLRQADVQKRLRDAEEKTSILKQRVESRRRLEQLGLTPRLSDERLQAEQVELDNQNMIAVLQAELKQLQSEYKQLETQDKELALDNLEASTTRQNTLQDVRSQIDLYQGQLERQSQVLSDRAGRILELTVNVGQLVEQGMRLGSIDISSPSNTLVGLTYFPIKDGKKIEPGMRIHIAPDTVERARFGSIVGRVTSVSAFPVTEKGIASLVGNPEVAAALVTFGPPIEVVADINPKNSNFSQYEWSSSTGPVLKMTSGTTTTARVVVEYRAPITYVVPVLREISGLNS